MMALMEEAEPRGLQGSAAASAEGPWPLASLSLSLRDPAVSSQTDAVYPGRCSGV